MTATTISKFDNAVCENLSAMRGGTYQPTEDGLSYQNEFGDKVQIADKSNFKNYIVECYAANDNGEPSEEDMRRELEEASQMLVDYDIDEHNNLFSQFYYIINLN